MTCLIGLVLTPAAVAPASALPARQIPAVAPGAASQTAPVPSPESPLPANLLVPEFLARRVTSMWQQSPTFRRQCARLAQHPHVIVRLELRDEVRGASARSRVWWRNGSLNASVQIDVRSPALFVEYIAHELEHVMEQVDGRDLKRLAAHGLDGVKGVGGSFETARARSVGRLVAYEVKRP